MIKIAIMGAGLSGLSCALYLEKNNIHSIIYEKRSTVGDRFVNGEIFLSVLTKPVSDPLAYLSENYNIHLQPVSNIKKLIISSEKKQAEINGHLGFISLRGRIENSLEKQLASQLKSKIIFNSTYSYEQLLRNYTHIVMATGDAAYSEKIQYFHRDVTVTLIGATVTGAFNPHTVRAWLNNVFAPDGYGYLIPFSEKEANIVIGFPETKNNKKKDKEKLWNKFYYQVQYELRQKLPVTDKFEINNYIIGTSSHPRIGNTLFTGNCFGSIMPFLGFGQFAAILTGIYAAQDLCGEDNYRQLVKHLKISYNNSLVLRNSLQKLNNSQLDLLVKIMDSNIGNKLFTSRHNFLKLISYILNPLNL
ncbi:MAG: NAD(P)-binding protein [Candidatus Woesearchaeota archaeon]